MRSRLRADLIESHLMDTDLIIIVLAISFLRREIDSDLEPQRCDIHIFLNT